MPKDIIKLFSEKYVNWSFSIDQTDVDMILIYGSIENNVSDMFDMLNDLSEHYDNNMQISINKSSRYSISIRRKDKAAKYSRMYTSGCFDIFHYGHLNILRKTKKLCDYLIVGVSTDELILKEKGKVPVIPFEERIKVVSAIKYVDEVIPQIDKNKQTIVDDYNIDAISVGDDWRGRFPETTCPVEYFVYTASVSSTILKDTLKLQNKV
jgi:glycerol-3-phosphate cytidylyltransferase